jgi:hypothetical protein
VNIFVNKGSVESISPEQLARTLAHLDRIIHPNTTLPVVDGTDSITIYVPWQVGVGSHFVG